jgi:hypothetical protein
MPMSFFVGEVIVKINCIGLKPMHTVEILKSFRECLAKTKIFGLYYFLFHPTVLEKYGWTHCCHVPTVAIFPFSSQSHCHYHPVPCDEESNGEITWPELQLHAYGSKINNSSGTASLVFANSSMALRLGQAKWDESTDGQTSFVISYS